MTQEDYIKREIALWGEDYIFDLIDRGYLPKQLVADIGGGPKLRWMWILDNHGEDLTNHSLTQANICATMPASLSVVSPVSTDRLTTAE